MRIVFDAVPLLGQRTGIGWCEAGQTGALIRMHPEDRFYFRLPPRCGEAGQEAIAPLLRENAQAETPRNADVTHCFNYLLPPGIRGNAVITVHDMVVYTLPRTVRARTLYKLRLGLRRSMARADRIVTDSVFSAREITRYFPEHAGKVRVVPCGVDLGQFHPVTDPDMLSAVRERYHTGEQYFLYLGTLEPRKNLPRLIKAYAAYAAQYDAPARLVLAGGRGWLCGDIFRTVQELHLEEHVIFPQYVAPEDRCALMSGALAFTFPSLYEGFGMPPLEAMACGTPVLVSDTASLPEVTGDAAVYVPPDDTAAITRGLCRLQEDKPLREALSRKGLRRAAAFTWERSAELLYNVYRELSEGGAVCRENAVS